jgi:Xaa-Pro aminopeptidase
MDIQPGYSLAERDRRWAIARSIMDAEEADALIVYGEPEPAAFAPDVYFTNERPGAIVVFPLGREPISLVPEPVHITDHMAAPGWVAPANMRMARHAYGLVDVLTDHGLGRARIGVIGQQPYGLWTSVLQQLPQAVFTPVGESFLLHTLHQSAEELAVLEHAAATGRAMVDAMLATTAPGSTEAEVYAAAMAAGSATAGVLLASGPESVSWGPPVWGYRPQPARVIEQGDLLLACVSCSYGMRETRHQVAIAVGELHPQLERAARVVRSCYEAGLAALRPGRTFGEVCAAMRAPLDEAGGWNPHPLVQGMNPYGPVGGFGAGLAGLPEASRYGLLAEATTTGHQLPLAPGMTFSLAPNSAFGRRLVHFGAMVVVGDGDPVELTPMTGTLLRV